MTLLAHRSPVLARGSLRAFVWAALAARPRPFPELAAWTRAAFGAGELHAHHVARALYSLSALGLVARDGETWGATQLRAGEVSL